VSSIFRNGPTDLDHCNLFIETLGLGLRKYSLERSYEKR
jgi:hypothetical protein